MDNSTWNQQQSLVLYKLLGFISIKIIVAEDIRCTHAHTHKYIQIHINRHKISL